MTCGSLPDETPFDDSLCVERGDDSKIKWEARGVELE